MLERDASYHLDDIVNKFIPGEIILPIASRYNRLIFT